MTDCNCPSVLESDIDSITYIHKCCGGTITNEKSIVKPKKERELR
jgi:hypothetical protein